MKIFSILLSFLMLLTISGVAQQEPLSFVIRKPSTSLIAFELEKMNVLYIGLDNPVLINSQKAISSVTISNGVITQSETDPNSYTIRVAKGLEATVNIYTEGSNGKEILLEQKYFRLKYMPNPEATFAGKTGSSFITQKELQNTYGVIATLGGFAFDLKFDIISFDITGMGNGRETLNSSNSNIITEKQKEFLKLMKPGQKVYIENIKALGPDGQIRNLSPIVLKII